MPPTITATKSNHKYGTTPLPSYSVSGITNIALWDSVGLQGWAGLFSAREGLSVDFSAFNQTHDVLLNSADAIIRVFDVVKPTWTSISAGVTILGNNDLEYTGASASEKGAVGSQSCTGGDCFIEVVASQAGNFYARGIGLSGGTHSYYWANSNADFMLVLAQASGGSIWVNGSPVLGAWAGGGFTYKDGDIFRLSIENGKVRCRKNGVLFYEIVSPTLDYPLYPIAGFYEQNGKLEGIRFWSGGTAFDMEVLKTTAIMPIHFDRQTEHSESEEVEISEAEGMRPKDRVVRYLSETLQKWGLVFQARRLSAFDTVKALRRFHKFDIPFYLNDKERNVETLVCFDSELSDRTLAPNLFDMSVRVKQYEEDRTLDTGEAPSLSSKLLAENNDYLQTESGDYLILE